MSNDTALTAPRAVAALADVFRDILREDSDLGFADFEERAILAGHEAMARALGLALTRRDRELRLDLPSGWRVHDVRTRTLATEVGDVEFECGRLRDSRGASSCPLAEVLDLPWGCRVSPGASAFLVEAGAEVSYASSARLLARKGGSHVSATTVMRTMRQAGALCEADDERAARDLFDLGLKPSGGIESEEICVEADGTWVRLQGACEGEPGRVEIKALVAYSGKAGKGRKVLRENAVRHGCAALPDKFWTQGIAAIGSAFDLSKIERVHLGTDGEGWCKRGGAYLPMRMEVAGHLDPFHVNRAVLSCFEDPKAGWKVLEVLLDGGKEEAATLLEACRDLGVAREKNAARVLGYLRNNMDLIGIEGPTLGTMESENQHLYKSRMASVPCAWSRRGASDMARIRSRVRPGRKVPRQTRAGSVSPIRRKRTEDRELSSLAGPGAGSVVQSVGRGYLPPQASVSGKSAEVRHAAGLNSAMAPIAW